MARERADPCETRARDVDCHHELWIVVFRETAAAFVDCLVETDRGSIGQKSRLDRHELPGLHGLADGDYIGLRHVTEVPFADPDADPGMALGEQDDRIETGSLEGCGKKEGETKTGGEALPGHSSRAPNLLALPFERGGRLGVGESQAGGSRPESGGKKVCAPRIPRLVAVHRTVMARGLQNPRRVLYHTCDGRIIRGDECRKELGHVVHTAPLVARKEVDPALLHDRRKTLRLHVELELSNLRFVEACQTFDVEGYSQVMDCELRFTPDPVNDPDPLSDDGRGGTECNPHIRKGLSSWIVDREPFDDRNIVLSGSEVDPLQSPVAEGYGAGFLLSAVSFCVVVIVWQFLFPFFSQSPFSEAS